MNGTVDASRTGISWHGDAMAVLGPISFGINDVQLSVDAAFPTQVIDLSATSADALRSAAQWFAESATIEAIATAADGTTIGGPTLSDAVARVATVRAVDAIHLGDLDEAVLLLDQANAYTGVADHDAAHHFYSLSAVVVDRLVDEIDASGYAGPLVDRIRELIRAAPGSFAPTDRRRMLAVLNARADAEDHIWQSFSHDVSAELSSLAIDLGSTTAFMRRTLADFGTLWPRVLVFEGPDEPEVSVEVGPDTVELEARLRADVHPESTEVVGIFAVVADAATGDLLAYSPTRVADHRVHATVHVAAAADSIRCAFIRTGVELSRVRLDPAGAALNRIDRHCRYAWTEHRRAGALRASAGVNVDGKEIEELAHTADQADRRAIDAIETAVDLARQLSRRHRNSPLERELTGYRDALDRFARVVSAHAPTDGATGPTIAELYAGSGL